MNWQRSCLLACCLSLAAHAGAVDPGKDPVPSVMWAFYHKQMLGEAPFVFDERVKLLAPPFAEDARQVPLEIDARAFKGEVVRILAWAELNPLPKIVSHCTRLSTSFCVTQLSSDFEERPLCLRPFTSTSRFGPFCE